MCTPSPQKDRKFYPILLYKITHKTRKLRPFSTWSIRLYLVFEIINKQILFISIKGNLTRNFFILLTLLVNLIDRLLDTISMHIVEFFQSLFKILL